MKSIYTGIYIIKSFTPKLNKIYTGIYINIKYSSEFIIKCGITML